MLLLQTESPTGAIWLQPSRSYIIMCIKRIWCSEWHFVTWDRATLKFESDCKKGKTMLEWRKQEIKLWRMCQAPCYLASPPGSFLLSTRVPRLFLLRERAWIQGYLLPNKFYGFLNPLWIMALSRQHLRSRFLCKQETSLRNGTFVLFESMAMCYADKPLTTVRYHPYAIRYLYQP